MDKYRYLVCISSYKRPIQVLGQIHRFYKQSYDANHYDLSVVVRGCDDYVFDIVERECSIYPNLILTNKPNGDQLNNLLDCIRQSNYTKYDYYLKVDDDDIYCLDYIKNIHNKLIEHECSPVGFYNNQLHQIQDKNDLIKYVKTIHYIFGNSFGFNRRVYDLLEQFALHRNLEEYNIFVPSNISMSRTKEDALIDFIMKNISNENQPYININTEHQIYYCNLSSSILNYHA